MSPQKLKAMTGGAGGKQQDATNKLVEELNKREARRVSQTVRGLAGGGDDASGGAALNFAPAARSSLKFDASKRASLGNRRSRRDFGGVDEDGGSSSAREV